MMTKKDFISLACLIRENPADFGPDAIGLMATWFQDSNPRFNRDLWLSYIRGECGPNGGKLKGGSREAASSS